MSDFTTVHGVNGVNINASWRSGVDNSEGIAPAVFTYAITLGPLARI
jgi:hypothetical protein